ncbi:uncharacterized protein LOC129962581 isoform X1 [Argiope bruennichi]|uniref:uncharacterized protein LOC129962581 isoform X1 n=2 Tax=Argiope bruennichi TaxID=94029 RepID=UPI00249564B9|nr:uncharacterized protein LOC129962581 isoform X1 [Argiope bruennichi]
MANKEQNSDKNAPVFSGFTELYLRKLGENLFRKNQNPGPRIAIKKLDSVYAYEISCMMHTLGDVAKPLKSSVQYLETILRDQMNLLLIKASEIPGPKALTHTRLLPLIAHKREKMTRLLQYLFLKDSCELLRNRKYEEYADAVDNGQCRKRVGICLKFLKSIGAGDYDMEVLKTSLLRTDDIALERAARRFQMSRLMSNENYLKFFKKQSVGFYPKNDGGMFEKWLLADKVTTLQPTPLALDILAYFARETLSEIVEATLQIDQPKKDSKINTSNILAKKNHQSSADRTGTFSFSTSDIFSPGRLRDLITDNSDSCSVNFESLGMTDIFPSSMSPKVSLSENDAIVPAKESSCTKKRKMETMDFDTKNNSEKSEVEEMKRFQESEPRLVLQEPKIPPRNPGNPITVDDLRSTVMNLIILQDEEFQFSKKKRILCL